MIRLEELYDFMQGSFDYLLVLDDRENLVHASDLFRRDCLPEGMSLNDLRIADLVTEFSLGVFRSAMARAKAGNRAIAVFSPADKGWLSIPLKAGCATTQDGNIYIFFGQKMAGLSRRTEAEKDARIKELACLYRVMEWIEVSPSISAFFTELPRYLASGMLSPEEVVIYSVYEGVEYGQKPTSRDVL
jgi:hypothetical protein